MIRIRSDWHARTDSDGGGSTIVHGQAFCIVLRYGVPHGSIATRPVPS